MQLLNISHRLDEMQLKVNILRVSVNLNNYQFHDRSYPSSNRAAITREDIAISLSRI
jgi:hypothetical protein